eukprot:scaffold70359_cov37-Prasinocladus_malaysianus.AAC.1
MATDCGRESGQGSRGGGFGAIQALEIARRLRALTRGIAWFKFAYVAVPLGTFPARSNDGRSKTDAQCAPPY